jgi:peptidoglycan hydrolase CwlO-like protein
MSTAKNEVDAADERYYELCKLSRAVNDAEYCVSVYRENISALTRKLTSTKKKLDKSKEDLKIAKQRLRDFKANKRPREVQDTINSPT